MIRDAQGPRRCTPKDQDSKKQVPLSDLDRKYFLRCSAIIGSGTYHLKGVPHQQIEVLKLSLQRARSKGADWQRIYVMIYDYWAARRPLLPSVDKMAAEIEQMSGG